MYGLTTTKGLNKSPGRRYGLTAAALAALMFLSLTPVQAQGLDKAIRILYKAKVDPIGLAPGQTLSLTVFNPWIHLDQGGRTSAAGTDDNGAAQRSIVRSVVVVFDSQNNPIARTEEVEIPMGEFRSFKINRDDLSLAGEPRTRRLQVRAEVEIVLLTTSSREAREFEASLSAPISELVDNDSGRTTVHGGLVKLGSKRLVLESDGTY